MKSIINYSGSECTFMVSVLKNVNRDSTDKEIINESCCQSPERVMFSTYDEAEKYLFEVLKSDDNDYYYGRIELCIINSNDDCVFCDVIAYAHAIGFESPSSEGSKWLLDDSENLIKIPAKKYKELKEQGFSDKEIIKSTDWR